MKVRRLIKQNTNIEQPHNETTSANTSNSNENNRNNESNTQVIIQLTVNVKKVQ